MGTVFETSKTNGATTAPIRFQLTLVALMLTIFIMNIKYAF